MPTIAQAAAQTPLVDILLPFLPWLIVIAVLFPVVRSMTRTQRAISKAYIERMHQHMAAVESKLDQLVAQGEQRAAEAKNER